MDVLIIAISVLVVLASVFYTGYTTGQLSEMNKTLKFLEELQNIRRRFEDGPESD